jgi:anaerobic selenocysteine-containing dehydrogenase
LSEELCKAAQTNVDRLRGCRSPVQIHNGVAQEFDYSEGTVFTLFNPFGGATLQAVLSRIHDDTIGKGLIRIAYANPIHEREFEQHTWLERYEMWDSAANRLEHSVSFYRSRADSRTGCSAR